MTTLLITNGDSTAYTMREAGIGRLSTGESAHVLPWRDALHWGEIPDHPDLPRASDVRARAMARLWDGVGARRIRAEFRARDALVLDHARFDAIELWFEHDLHDQLQLVQILHVLHGLERAEGVTLVQADDYLGHQRAHEIGRFASRAVPVTSLALSEATSAWEAITAPTPAPVFDMVRRQDSFLPYLCPALARWLEELPDAAGLARSERQILELIADRQGGETTLRDLFARTQAREVAVFEGDLGFLAWVHGLALGATPLVEGLADPMVPDASAHDGGEAARRVWGSRLALTEAGHAVLEARADHVDLNGLDRWWGGTHLRFGQTWRWVDGDLVSPRAERLGAGS